MKSERRSGKIKKLKWNALIFVVLFATLAFVSVGCASATTIYVNPCDLIQDAIDVANPGDIIIVRDGTYTENINVYKRLTIRSENGADSTTVNAGSASDYVFEVTADYVNISGFTVENATGNYAAGIYLYGVEHCNISDNNALNNYYGIHLDSSSNNTLTGNNASNNNYYGIRLDSSSNNTITGTASDSDIRLEYSSNNTISNNNVNSGGIYLVYSSNNTISGNIVSDSGSGIVLWYSDSILIENCIVEDCTYDGISFYCSANAKLRNNSISNTRSDNFGVRGTDISHFYHDIDTSNLVNGKPIYYVVEQEGLVFDGEVMVIGYLGLVSCEDILVKNLTISDNEQGVLLVNTSLSKIVDSHFSSNGYGITLWGSDNVFIENCNIEYNNDVGIYIPPRHSSQHSSNITIKSCNLINNIYGIHLSYSDNVLIENCEVSKGAWSITIRSSDNVTIKNSTVLDANTHGPGWETSSCWGISIRTSDNALIENCNVLNSDWNGITIENSCSNCTIRNGVVRDSGFYGINAQGFDNSLIEDCIVENNCHGGIYLWGWSSNNLIYNNYFNNTNNALDNGNNIWNITKTAGTNIIGGSWLGGNYWSDYDGIDANGDGLGDTLLPYNSYGNIIEGGDHHPLVPAGFAPLLSIKKSDNPDPVLAGGTLNYSIVVSDTGYLAATNVTVTETYDINVTFVSAVPAPSEGNDTWIFPTLNVSETNWINISVTVNASVLNGTVLHNVVNVSCEEGVTDSDTENTTVFVAHVLNCTCGDICVNETGWWRDGGAFKASSTPIQDAIDNATAGETICVKDGTYTENVDVNTPLTIKSENGADYTTVPAASSSDHVFAVTADYVTISGFTVTGAAYYPNAGIYVDSANYCTLSDNNALNNGIGIYLFSSSNYNTLTNNTASNNNGNGIYLDSSSNNTIINNTANSNSEYGISLESSNNNNIKDNTLTNNDYGMRIRSSNNINVINNTATSNSYLGVFLSGIPGQLISNNNIINNDVSNNNEGFYLGYANNTNVTDNILNSNNKHGIRLDHSSNNSLINNTANSNNRDGIRIECSSKNNIITNNNISNNHGEGITIYSFSNNNNIINNIALNNNHGIGLYDSSDYNNIINNLANLNNEAGIFLRDSNSNNVTNNTVNSNSERGIWFWSSLNNTLQGNTIKSNTWNGIHIGSSSNNTVSNNNASNNNKGIYVYSSSNNLIYNNYFNNTNNAYDDGNNIWNITKTAGTNIIGGSWIGGNYWSDYEGEDTDGDGLGDTLLPYNSGGEITTGGDWHPLVPAGIAPPEITSFAPPSPVTDTVCNWRTFNVTINQTANVSWYLNEALQQTNESVQEARCRLHAEVAGEHNVTAIASNPNGTDMQMWIWNVTEESSHTFECSAGWNMISFPVEPLDNDADTIFGPEYYYLCTWDSDTGCYVPVDAVETEIGYWLLVLEDRNVTAFGTQLTEYNTDITQGWNMIGSLWTATNVPDGTETVPADQLYPYIYGWCGDHYALTQDIEPGLGYWALAYVDCGLHVFPAPSAAPLPVQQITWGDNDWHVRLALTSGAGTDVAEFGLHEDATDDFSAEFDVPEPPSPPPSATSPYQQVYFYDPENPVVKKLSTCYIPHHFVDDDDEEYNSWLFRLDYSGDASDVTITWNAEDINAVPAEYSLLFIVDGEQIDMRTTPSYTFRAKTRTYEFEIRAITGGKKPDLVIEEEYENHGGQAGSYTVFFVVKNIGTATAPEGHYATLYVDGVEIDKKLVSTDLEPGETYKGSFKTKVGLTGKVENIKVCADSYNDVDELDEANNCLKSRWQHVDKPPTDKPPTDKLPTDKLPTEKEAGLSD